MLSRYLQKLSTFFQIDMRKILMRGSYLLSGQVVGNIFSLLIALAAAHFITKELYGTYRYVLSIVGLVSVFSLTGLSTAIIRSTARGHDSLYTHSIRKSLLWSLPAILIGLGVGVWYYAHNNTVLGFSIGLGSIIFPCIQALLLYRSFLNGKEYFQALMRSNIIYSVITSVAVLIALALNPSVELLVCVYYISNLIITAGITYHVRKKYKPNTSIDPEGGKLEHHISLMNILDSGATHLDKIILFQISGPVEVARYVFATAIPEQLRNIIKYAPTLSLPIFASLPDSIAKSKGLFLARKLFLVTVPLVIVYFFIAPVVYKLFFPTYQEVVSYSQAFALILLFDGGITGTVLKAKNQIKKLYTVNIISSISKIVLLVVLGMTMGVWGVIVSRVASRCIGFFISYIALKNTFKEHEL